MSPAELRALLEGLPVPEVQYCDVAGSTNDLAGEWATAGAADGCLVCADQQVKGRGRLGRSWVTNPGVALAFSLVLHPSADELKALALLSPAAALAVSQALEGEFGLHPAIKWPNDVLLSGRKVCGILAEANWAPEGQAQVVLGIGLNISPGSVPPAGELLFPATCLEDEIGRSIDRWRVLRAVLAQFFAVRATLGTAPFLEAWSQRLAFRGETVKVQGQSGAATVGTLAGVSTEGNLLLKLEDGHEMQFSAGDVHLRPAGDAA